MPSLLLALLQSLLQLVSLQLLPSHVAQQKHLKQPRASDVVDVVVAVAAAAAVVAVDVVRTAAAAAAAFTDAYTTIPQ